MCIRDSLQSHLSLAFYFALVVSFPPVAFSLISEHLKKIVYNLLRRFGYPHNEKFPILYFYHHIQPDELFSFEHRMEKGLVSCLEVEIHPFIYIFDLVMYIVNTR